MSFVGKVVIVTGASSGIGAATAVMLCREGASVALVGRNEQKLKTVSENCSKAGGKHIVIRADVAKDIEATKIVLQTISEFGKLDILVNNAGVGGTGSILDGKLLESFDGLVNTNFRAVLHLTTSAAPHLIKTKGNIVNVSSASAYKHPMPTTMAYACMKAALVHFTKGAANELSSSGVRVNSVSPGPVVTDFLENSGSKQSWDIAKPMTTLNRVSDSDEIAELILFLASDKARGITGTDVVADNGFLIK